MSITVGGTPLGSEPVAASGDLTRAALGRYLGALVGAPLLLRDEAVAVVVSDDLASSPVGALSYDAGDRTLTSAVDGNLNDATGRSFAVGDRFLWVFTATDRARSGVYALADLGAVDRPPAWRRAADFDASGDFAKGAAVLGTDNGGGLSLYRLTYTGTFTLDTTAQSWELIDAAYLVAAGT